MVRKKFAKTIPTHRQNVRTLLDEALTFFRSQQASGNACGVSEFWFLLALDEMVENSLIHGNQNDPSKTIAVSIEPLKESVKLIVTDEGKGFRPTKLPDPTTQDNFMKENGRGVFILRSIADVSWNQKGNKITVVI